ncbi:MAG: ABC transporter permease, partial [Nanoarchaeota archaeon]|nr:ABC transporter permease [Nanoarchaeota archaeon]
MLGIFIGIAAVVSLIGLGEGLRVGISTQFGNLGTDVLSVQASGLNFAGPPGTGTPDPLTTDLTDKIARVGNVDHAIDRYLEAGTMTFNGKNEIGYSMSVPSGEKRKVAESVLNIEAEDGRMLKDGDKNKVVLGNNFKDDKIYGRPIKVGDRVLIDDINFQVVGILKKKGSFIFDNIVLIEEADLINYLKDEGDESVNVIAVKVKDENQIDKTKTAIEKLLRK